MENLSHRAMFASLDISTLGGIRKDEELSFQLQHITKAELGVLSAVKKIIPPHELKDIKSVCTSATTLHKKLTLQTSITNVRILPTTLFDEHSEGLRDFGHEFRKNVDRLVERWPKILDNAPDRLGSAYNKDEFPSVHDISRHFNIKTRYNPIPDNYSDWVLDGVSPDVVDGLKADLSSDINEMYNDAASDVYKQAQKVMQKLSNQCKNFTGKQGQLREITVSNMREFVMLFKGFNIFDDPTLEKAADEMNRVVNVTARELREDDKIRNTIAKRTQKIVEMLQEKSVS